MVPAPVEPVTAELPRAPNCSATPSSGAVWALESEGRPNSTANAKAVEWIVIRRLEFIQILRRFRNDYGLIR
jgi:hypothetical protein